jgi:hypothetical protein
VTTIAMRPASERRARGFAAIRSLSCQISPRYSWLAIQRSSFAFSAENGSMPSSSSAW